jgi:hypothetical protein
MSAQEVKVRMLEHILQSYPKGCTKKIPSNSIFATYRAQITGPKLSNSVLCGLYLKILRKLP